MKRPYTKSTFTLIIFLGFFLGTTSMGHAGPGDLLVSPVRVVFDGRERTVELTLVNRSSETATYRIALQNKRMLEDGSFELIEDARDGELFSAGMLRYAPRRVQLAPNQPQTVRILLRKPPELNEAEYRSHLHFSSIPESKPSDTIGDEDESDSISIKLTPIYGVTVPVIVRHGKLNVSIRIDDAKLITMSDGVTPGVEVQLSRQGTRSVYGSVKLALGDGPSAPMLGEVRGMAIYSPNTKRRIQIPIRQDVVSSLAGKSISVSFEEHRSQGEQASDTAQFVLN